MKLFPFYMDVTNTRFLIIGGGRVAAGKISRLTAFSDRITVVAPEAEESVLQLSDEGRLKYVRRAFLDSDLDGCDCVIAATGDRALNGRISEICRQRHIPVNSVDEPENCTFFFPAIIRKGHLTVSISTDGASPACAAWLKREIGRVIPENIDGILDIMQEVRASFPGKHPDIDQRQRAAVYRQLLTELLAAERMPGAEETERMIAEICAETGDEAEKCSGEHQ
ncbi:MAG: precorrin-2 dehydrogenase/sirohydrochlorin ferrochelatase family protein [Bilifractor sp.]|nr:bifunctional precorrin-2 dehydrogenase/sirohydrochlorin ferrochelatase [Lachnospiraceae bacterium]